MPTSIRLDPQAARLLRQLARQRGETRSAVVRAAIHALAGKEVNAGGEAASVTAYDRLAHVIGVVDSGGQGLSTDTGERFRTMLQKKPRVSRPR